MIKVQCVKSNNKNCAMCSNWTGYEEGFIVCKTIGENVPCKMVRKWSVKLWIKAILNIYPSKEGQAGTLLGQMASMVACKALKDKRSQNASN